MPFRLRKNRTALQSPRGCDTVAAALKYPSGSFAKTFHGHGTDKALLGGILGFRSDDERIVNSFALAEERGLEFEFLPDTKETEIHPNTADIVMECADGRKMTVRGDRPFGSKTAHPLR